MSIGRALTPRRLMTAGLVLLVAAVLVLLFKKSDRLLEVPDDAHALSGVVSIPGSKPAASTTSTSSSSARLSCRRRFPSRGRRAPT